MWLRKTYNKITGSIAFYPAIIAIGFLLLAWLMLELDFSEAGKHIKAGISWITLHDANTARSIVSTIVAGIISLTVFSFSMVMILLNQAASQMSNRMLDSMIGNRFQQIILGFYIGSIVYALFLLSSVRDIDSGIYVPALSIYLLLLLTVADIFLFIYFLHYVTQTIKYETIIQHVHKKTLTTLNNISTTQQPKSFIMPGTDKHTIYMRSSDFYQGFSKKQLVEAACKYDGVVEFLHPPGTYLLEEIPLLNFYTSHKINKEVINNILDAVDFYKGQPIEKNAFYGFHQLAEVAVKALSPGINDPQTAVLSIQALSNLFYFRLNHFIKTAIEDENNVIRIYAMEWSFEDLFAECFYPIWDYGKKDRYIQNALQQMLDQLKKADVHKTRHVLFTLFQNKIQKEIDTNE